MNATDEHPTLLRMPPWLGFPEERKLPLAPDAYALKEVRPDWWEVRAACSGELIYSGLGPVEIVRSPAPF
ncbi:hypothetical protein IB236_12960 [Acidovorax sp. ACV02]|uniref:hypothetical protein n=1 Tax=Acidovorax sp. ACV02 TaxID=2769310 RepID=UPI00177A9476|nr:hypothetical protein [Acidovorax sp. ACV02]MBD9406251.1 hypothetical protein [Acidovorax sp. ACV02]